MATVPTAVCSLEGCPANSGGACLEGHETIDECPNVVGVESPDGGEVAPDDEPDEGGTQPVEERRVDLPRGSALTALEANPILARGDATTVLLAGEAESGKTTLLAALYERFQDGPFEDYLFAGSDTLPAFEERCFLARVASGRSTATTKRTTLTDSPRMLHLGLTHRTSRVHRDLLAVDVAGERFTAARNNNDAWDAIPIMGSLDRFVLLIDGAKIAEPATRQQVLSASRQLMRSALEAGVVAPNIVDVVVTKWDLVQQAGDQALSAVENVLERLNAVAGAEGQINEIRTAARSETEFVAAGYGLDELLRSWLEEARQRRTLPSTADLPQPLSPFDRYQGQS